MTNTQTQTHDCPRCAGNGRIEQFRHVDNGRCLLCLGTGQRPGPARKPRARKPRKGDNERLWAEFTQAHPAEAKIVADDFEPDRPGWNRTPELGYAYASVATFSERNSNWPQALDLIARYQRQGR